MKTMLALMVLIAGVAAAEPVYDIPRLNNVVIDGKTDDWGDGGFRVETLAGVDGKVRSPADLDVRVRLGWDDRGLLGLVTVHDDAFVESDTLNTLWQNDSMELYLVDGRGGKQLIQALLAPGLDAKHPELRHYIIDHRKDEELKKTQPTLTAARTRISGGYVMEVLLPWANIGLQPRIGSEAGLQMFVNDVDVPDAARVFNAVWYPAVGTFMDTTRVHRLRLSEKASAPVTAVGRAHYDGMKSTRLTVVGMRELAGQPVVAQADGAVIARGTLAEIGGRSVAKLKAGLPPVGTNWKQIELLVDGRVVDTVAMPDAEALRAKALPELKYVFQPFCFFGNDLPEGDFAEPVEAGNILGPATVRVTYYDAQFQPVTSADKPGRYGAIVEITPAQGAVIHRYVTLYRLPGDLHGLDQRDLKLPVTIELPPELGLNPGIVREQQETLGEFTKRLWMDGFTKSADSAIVMAWLTETGPETRTTARNDPWSAERKWMHELKRRTGHAQPLPYHVLLPQSRELKMPAIIVLHGSGERANPFEKIANHAMARYAKAHTNFPFIVIIPHCPPGQWWQVPALDELYDEVLEKYPVDPDRVYLTGQSMGGFGSWMWAAEHPGRFAAVAPVCGGGDPREAEYLQDVPIWNFHGAKDPAVSIRLSDEMVEALRKVQGRVRYTVYPDAGHGIWDTVYRTDEFYTWLLQQVRQQPAQPRGIERK